MTPDGSSGSTSPSRPGIGPVFVRRGTVRGALASALLAVALSSSGAEAPTPDDYLEHRWHRIEMVVFERQVQWPPARPRQLDPMRLPLRAFPLAGGGFASEGLAVGSAPYRAVDELPLLISNVPPPLWFTGKCASVAALPAGAFDPCVEVVDLEARFPDDPLAVWDIDRPPREVAPAELDDRAAALQAIVAGFEAHEDELLASSYRWQPTAPSLERLLPRLRSAFRVVVVGSWHQPLPPRNAPQPLLVQVGVPSADGRFAIEGWLSVVAGRYAHIDYQLQYRLPTGGVALLAEGRRMRNGEEHYFDHPVTGILARVDELDTPPHLLALIDAYAALAEP